MSDIAEIIVDLSRDVRNNALDGAIEMINIDLSDPEVMDSKVACDALKRAIENIRSLKVP